MTSLPPTGIYSPSLMLGGYLWVLQLATPASSSSRGGLHCAVGALTRLIGEQPELHSQGPSSSMLAKVGDTFPCFPPTPPTGCLLGAPWGRRKVPLYPMTQRAVVAPTPGQSGHCPCLVGRVPRASDRSWWAVTVMGAQGRGTGSPADSSSNQLHVVHIKYLFLVL